VSFGGHILSGLRITVPIEERTKILDETLKGLKAKVAVGLADHEKRLVRLETMVEIARPDGAALRIGRDTPS